MGNPRSVRIFAPSDLTGEMLGSSTGCCGRDIRRSGNRKRAGRRLSAGGGDDGRRPTPGDDGRPRREQRAKATTTGPSLIVVAKGCALCRRRWLDAGLAAPLPDCPFCGGKLSAEVLEKE